MGRRCNYDPMLRKTEHGASLYQTWRKIRMNPHCEEWDSFPGFYNWAMKNGYTLSAWLRLVDALGPYCPENCVWYFPGEDKWKRANTDSWIEKWNRSVNRIRKHYGMPPLEGTDYGD